jgi:hypothetical protein
MEGALTNTPRQRPTLPLTRVSSTIGAKGLNFRVRNGNGCFPSAMVTGNSYPKLQLHKSKIFMVKPLDRLVSVS